MILLSCSNNETNIAIISLIIAGISVLFAIRSSSIAKKALNLARTQYDDKQPDFDLYYNKGLRFIAKSKDSVKKILLFHMTISNKSEFRNSFKSELEIEYLRDDDSLARLLIEHNPLLKEYLKNDDMSLFPFDIELEAKSTTTKWLIFEQPSFLDNNHRIENFVIKLTDLAGNKSSIEAVLIKDVEK